MSFLSFIALLEASALAIKSDFVIGSPVGLYPDIDSVWELSMSLICWIILIVLQW